MSGSIGRSYLIQSWNGASEYSGEMLGSRVKQSTQLFLANGQANTALFADEEKSKRKPKDLMYRVLPQQSSIERLEAMKEELEKEFDNGSRSLEEYSLLSIALDKKLDRAFRALERATSHSNAVPLPSVENAYNSGKSLLKQHITIDYSVDYSILSEESIFSQLSDGNIFKIFAVKLLTAKRNVAKMYTVVKQIVEEGLL